MSQTDPLALNTSLGVEAFVIGNKLQSLRTAFALGDKPELAALYKMQDAGKADTSSKATPNPIDKAAIATTIVSMA